MAINVYDLSSTDPEPVYTFEGTTPQRAVMYCEAERRQLLSWFFNTSDEERAAKLKPITGKNSITCGDFAACLDQ